MSSNEEFLAFLHSRDEIREVMLRYSRGIDRLDLELVRSCFHPDAFDHHGGVYHGDIEGFIAFAEKFLRRYESTMHFLSMPYVELFEDIARVETYAVAYHRARLDNGSSRDDVFGIRYVDRFERRSNTWRIAHRIVATEWRRVDYITAEKSRRDRGIWGRRDRNDPINWILHAHPDIVMDD